MDSVHKFIKKNPADCYAFLLFLLAIGYALFNRMAHTILLGIAFVLILMYGLPKQPIVAFLVGALVMFLLQPRIPKLEGFSDVSGEHVVDVSGAPVSGAPVSGAPVSGAEKFSGGAKPMVPNNRDHKGMFELGKPYKLPTEGDDKGYHLDAGTTFLNAYKALKPDQIAAMTKDTQELLATQKSLIGMLESFGPLMKDMKQITGFLNT